MLGTTILGLLSMVSMIRFYCFIAPAPAVTFVIASTQLHLLDYDLCGLSKYLGFSF